MDNTKKAEATKALLLALTYALNALGWSATLDEDAAVFGHALLRIPGFPNFRTPEIRTKVPSDVREYYFVWNGATAKKPETMAARIAEALKKEADAQKEAEAKKTTPIHVTAAERALLESALRIRRGTLSDYLSAAPSHWSTTSMDSKNALSAEVEALTELLSKIAVAS